MTHGNSKYSPKIAAEICEHISNGGTLAEKCRELEIGYTTVFDWEKKHPEFAESIAHARKIGYEVIAERTRETARGRGESTNDVQRDKLIIEQDMKLLAKWSPRYAEKAQVELSGGFNVQRIERVIVDAADTDS